MKDVALQLSRVLFSILLFGIAAAAQVRSAGGYRNGDGRLAPGQVLTAVVTFDPQGGGQDVRQITWETQADNLRGRNGQQVVYRCPAAGTISGRLWGTGLYTDDSSICTAAVHSGLISARSGGVVKVEIRAGAGSYEGSTRNGVSSKGYGGWPGSFVFVTGGAGATADDADVTVIDWATQADAWRGQNGRRYVLRCPANGVLSGRLWGTDLYTDDSSVCTAAVHAGLISTSRGGVVAIEIRPGASSYSAMTRNGVNSRGYGEWRGSFIFVHR